MGGSIIHPSWDKSECRMACSSSFWCVDVTGNLSLQKMNLNIFTLLFGLGVKGGLAVVGVPKRHSLYDRSRVGHSHLGR
jgi:hypothetical protein